MLHCIFLLAASILIILNTPEQYQFWVSVGLGALWIPVMILSKEENITESLSKSFPISEGERVILKANHISVETLEKIDGKIYHCRYTKGYNFIFTEGVCGELVRTKQTPANATLLNLYSKLTPKPR